MSVTAKEIKIVRSLSTKKGRREEARFLAEGIRLLEEAFRFNFLPEKLFANPSELTDRGTELVRRAQRQGISVIQVNNRDLGKMADTETSQGLLGVFRTPAMSLDELSTRRPRTLLVCDRISDPGNLGTLIRSALAFGFDAVVLTAGSVEPYSPKTVRSSAGAVFGLPIVGVETDELLAWTSSAQADIVAADVSAQGEIEVSKLSPERPVVLAVGAEADGLDRALLDRAAVRCRIAHRPTVDSLNAAIAGSILMKQLFDAREATE